MPILEHVKETGILSQFWSAFYVTVLWSHGSRLIGLECVKPLLLCYGNMLYFFVPGSIVLSKPYYSKFATEGDGEEPRKHLVGDKVKMSLDHYKNILTGICCN